MKAFHPQEAAHGRVTSMNDAWTANTRTTGRISLSVPVTGRINSDGDIDWLRVRLRGQSRYSVALVGYTLRDPFLEVYNDRGRRIAYNDDFASLDSGLVFRAPYTGYLYLAASSSIRNDIGTYGLSIDPYVPLRGAAKAAVPERAQALAAVLDRNADRPLGTLAALTQGPTGAARRDGLAGLLAATA